MFNTPLSLKLINSQVPFGSGSLQIFVGQDGIASTQCSQCQQCLTIHEKGCAAPVRSNEPNPSGLLCKARKTRSVHISGSLGLSRYSGVNCTEVTVTVMNTITRYFTTGHTACTRQRVVSWSLVLAVRQVLRSLHFRGPGFQYKPVGLFCFHSRVLTSNRQAAVLSMGPSVTSL